MVEFNVTSEPVRRRQIYDPQLQFMYISNKVGGFLVVGAPRVLNLLLRVYVHVLVLGDEESMFELLRFRFQLQRLLVLCRVEDVLLDAIYEFLLPFNIVFFYVLICLHGPFIDGEAMLQWDPFRLREEFVDGS